jgi:nicotinamide mononucleotide transporter
VNAFDWLQSTAFTAFGKQILWSDMIGNVLGLAALALGWRRSLLTWPAQLLSGAVLVVAYWSVHLSGGVGKQLLVVGVAVWGWLQWRHRAAADGGAVPVRFATWPERARLAAGTAAGTLALGWLFTAYPTLSWDPWPDAYLFTGSVAAMVAMARGWVEFWFAWLAVDAVGVPLAFHNGLAFSALVYLVYGVLVLLGLRGWWLQTRRAPSAAAGAIPEGAVA